MMLLAFHYSLFFFELITVANEVRKVVSMDAHYSTLLLCVITSIDPVQVPDG